MFLDDIREPWRVGLIGWTCVRTVEAAIAALKTGKVTQASLDHDMTIEQTLGLDDRKPTGYDVVLWMEANNVWPPGGTAVHSLNPTGKAKMERIIDRAYRRARTTDV